MIPFQDFLRSIFPGPTHPTMTITMKDKSGKPITFHPKAYIIAIIDENGVCRHMYEGEPRATHVLARDYLPKIVDCVRRTICDTMFKSE
jgi:hypothetical protein